MKAKGPLPPTYFFIFLLIAFPLNFLLPVDRIFDFPLNLIGIPFIIFGAWITVWADQIFKQLKTTVKPHEKPSVIVTSGPFGLSRHPMYLGMTAILLGEAVLLGSLTAFIAPLGFFLCMQIIFISVEERSMSKTFGDKYSNYKKKARMWF